MTDSERLIGEWRMTGAEVRTAEFHADGTLHYAIEIGERALVLELTWRIEEGMIISVPAGVDDEVRSVYEFPDDDTLVMRHEGETSTFRRRR
jgi:hypothetical protein